MSYNATLNRRQFLALGAAALAAPQTRANTRVPVGVLLLAPEKELNADFNGTLKAVAQMGFEGVEFTHYIDWTVARAKEVRAALDEVHLECYSTHNEPQVFTNRLEHAIEINSILGSKTVSCVRGL